MMAEVHQCWPPTISYGNTVYALQTLCVSTTD